MTREECVLALALALKPAIEAAKALRDQTLVPSVPLPAVRTLRLSEEFELRGPDGKPSFGEFLFRKDSPRWNSADDRGAICDHIGWDPRRLLRLVRRIQSWTSYVGRLAAGRARHAEEICRQQAGAVDALKAELALNALTKGP